MAAPPMCCLGYLTGKQKLTSPMGVYISSIQQYLCWVYQHQSRVVPSTYLYDLYPEKRIYIVCCILEHSVSLLLFQHITVCCIDWFSSRRGFMHASKLSFLKVSSLSRLKEQHVRGHLSLVPVDGELGSSRACMGADCWGGARQLAAHSTGERARRRRQVRSILLVSRAKPCSQVSDEPMHISTFSEHFNINK